MYIIYIMYYPDWLIGEQYFSCTHDKNKFTINKSCR